MFMSTGLETIQQCIGPLAMSTVIALKCQLSRSHDMLLEHRSISIIHHGISERAKSFHVHRGPSTLLLDV